MRKLMKTILVTLFAAAALVIPATAASADVLCNVSQNAYLYSQPSLNSSIVTTVYAGGGFRFSATSFQPDGRVYLLGNGNGTARGWMLANHSGREFTNCRQV